MNIQSFHISYISVLFEKKLALRILNMSTSMAPETQNSQLRF